MFEFVDLRSPSDTIFRNRFFLRTSKTLSFVRKISSDKNLSFDPEISLFQRDILTLNILFHQFLPSTEFRRTLFTNSFSRRNFERISFFTYSFSRRNFERILFRNSLLSTEFRKNTLHQFLPSTEFRKNTFANSFSRRNFERVPSPILD